MDNRFQTTSDAFLEWFAKSSPLAHISNKITLADLRGRDAGRGVVATDDIDENEELFVVPRSSVLCVETSEVARKIPGVFAECDEWTSLILVLLYEYFQGSSSPWKPYLDVLPASFDTLAFWSDRELEELQASAVRDKIGKQEADDSFRATVLPLIHRHKDVFFLAGVDAPPDVELMALAHRMASAIMAYAFDIEKDKSRQEVDEEGYATEEEDDALPKGMVPLADMLNADADQNNARLFYGSDALIMKALKPVKKGEELLNDYGPLPRSDLLRRYGYLTPGYSKYDVVEISQELVTKTLVADSKIDAQVISARLSYLEQQGLLEAGFDFTRAPQNVSMAETPLELVAVIQVLMGSEEDFSKFKKKGRFPHATLTPSLASLLAEIFRKRLTQYSTTIDEDRALLTAGPKSRRHNMAILVRLGEKEVLQEYLTYFISLQGEEHSAENPERIDHNPRKRLRIV